MKEKPMTNQQRYASTWSLSKICQALIGLGLCKIAVFVSLGLGYSLPDFNFLDFLSKDVAVVQEKNTPTAQQSGKLQNTAVAPTTALGKNPLEEQITLGQNSAPLAPQGDKLSLIPTETMPEPQGSAAVRAAQAYTNQKNAVLAAAHPQANSTTLPQTPPAATEQQQAEQPVQSQQAQTPAAVTAEQNTVKAMTVQAQMPEPEDVSWWTTLNISSLPIPRLGVDEVAYAATLDTNLNPPPAPPAATGNAPFSPPAQNIQPVGTAGPYGNTIPPYNPLVPTTNPPVPNVNAYVPAEDPLQKEQELARREQEILTLKQQMEQRLKELQAAERKVQGMLTEAKNVEQEKMTSLTDMYTNMKPRQAGAALEKLDENIAAKILLSMRAKQAGEILSYMNPIKTAKLTEVLTRMRIAQ